MVIKKLGGRTAKRSSTKKRSTKKDALKDLGPEELRSLIEKKAYEIYVKRGYTHGDDLGDWYQAEKKVKKSLK